MSAAVPAEGLSCPATASPVPSVEHGDGQSLRDELRSLPSIVGRAPDFDVQSAPANPRGLFLDWLRHAIDAQVQEPHAATLSTVDAGGMPDARVLIVKDVTAECGFRIATGDESAKGIQLRSNPQCALTFYWGPLARAVRIRGIAQRGSAAESAADFRGRHPAARTIALAGRQSSVMANEAVRAELLAEAAAALDADSSLVSPHWTVWTVVPVSIEFWQGDAGRNHQRLRYLREENDWRIDSLWS